MQKEYSHSFRNILIQILIVFFLLVEDYPSGYPQFAAIIGAHPDFSLSRRFTTSRARILLYKQDKVCAIENELDKLDRNETRSIFLGRFRGQNNAERVELLEKLDIALAEYGKL